MTDRAAEGRLALCVAVVFSKDRPLQLDGALRSLRHHLLDPESLAVKVIWTASSWRNSELYRRLGNEHPYAELIEEKDFKAQLIAATLGYQNVLFVVDDTIFVRPFSVASAAAVLTQDQHVLGFSFRLGRNIDYCYTQNRAQSPPDWRPRADGTLAFRWVGADADFGYPIEVSSSLYRSVDVRPLLKDLRYRNPNTLEAALAGTAGTFSASRPDLACLNVSAAFSAPVNVVQGVFVNRAGDEVPQSAPALAEAFRMGMRLDVEALAGFTTRSPHQEIRLPLKRRGPTIPLVSVVIPCFKQADYLPSAIESVVRQTIPDWEIVVVDDGSPDETAQVFERCAGLHPDRRMSLIRQSNMGVAAARNAGIARSLGIYVLPLDADDEVAETMLELTSELLDQDPSIAFVYTDAVHLRGDTIHVVPAEDFDPSRECEINQPNYAALFPRSTWETAGGYNSNMVWGHEDWDFWLSCVDHSLLGRRVPQPLFRYRVRPDTRYSTALEHDRELLDLLRRNHPALFSLRMRAMRLMGHLSRRIAWWVRGGLWTKLRPPSVR